MHRTPEQLALINRLVEELRRAAPRTPQQLAEAVGASVPGVMAMLHDDSRFARTTMPGVAGFVWKLDELTAATGRALAAPADPPPASAPKPAPTPTSLPASPEPPRAEALAQQARFLEVIAQACVDRGISRNALARQLGLSESTWGNARRYLLTADARTKLEAWLKGVPRPSVARLLAAGNELAAALAEGGPLIAYGPLAPSAAAAVVPPTPPAPEPEPEPPIAKLQVTSALGDLPLSELLPRCDRLNALLVDLGALSEASIVRQCAERLRAGRAAFGA